MNFELNWALRELARLPCLVEIVARVDELPLVACSKCRLACRVLFPGRAAPALERFLRSQDFDPKNGKTPRIQKPLKMTGINFVVEGYEVKQFALMDRV